MSDDPPSSSAARAGNVNGTNSNESAHGPGRRLGRDGDDASPSQSARDGRRRKKGKNKHPAHLLKKLSFVTDLQQGLDYLVFAELSALYYMEYVKLSSCIGAMR